MKTLLFHIFEKLRSGFWFVPGLITAVGALLAGVCLWIDNTAGSEVLAEVFPWLKPATADGIRSVLTTIATSVLTIAGVSFSVTTVSFQLASQQFGPRLIRNFVRAPQTQSVLGALIGTFLFCAVVLRATKGGDAANIPQISGLVALLLAIISLGLFIRFIDHTAQSIQAGTVIRGVYDDLDLLIEERFPTSRPEPVPSRLSGSPLLEIASSKTGYLQAINTDRLVLLAAKNDLLIQMCQRPGDFIHEGSVVAKVSDLRNPASDPFCEAERSKIRRAIRKAQFIGNGRTPEQDFEFCVQQLVEIALRALSPGVNDPVTAMTCANYLSAALTKLTSRHLPPAALTDDAGTLRLVLESTNYDGLLGAAFDQLRQTAIGHCDVSCRLLEGLSKIAGAARDGSQRESISIQAKLIIEGAEAAVDTDRERAALKDRFQAVRDSLAKASLPEVAKK